MRHTSEDFVELLSTGRSFAALCPTDLNDSLQSAFLGTSGLVFLVALDHTRKTELQHLADTLAHADLSGLPPFAAVTPCELEIMRSEDPARFKTLHVQRFIAFAEQADLRDLALRYWFNVLRETALHAPVAYLCSDTSTRNAFAVLPDLVVLSREKDPQAPPTREVFYFPDTGDTPALPQSLRARLKKARPALHARLEHDRLRLDEAIHRAHLQNPERNALTIHIDPITPVSGTVVTTSTLALLTALTMHEAGHIPDETPALTAYSLFAAIHAHALDSLNGTPLEQSLIADYQNSGIIQIRNGALSLTPKSLRMFPGTQAFAQLGILHAYAHDTLCRTASGAPLGRIETRFLCENTAFILGKTLYRKHFHDLLGGEAVLKAQSEPPRELSLDRLPFTCSRAQAEDIRKLLQDGTEPTAILAPEAADRLAELRNAFASRPHAPFIEMTSDAAHWWTFAGTDINRMLADCVRKIAPKLRLSVGCLHLRIDWAPSPDNAGTALREKLLRLSQALHANAKQMPPALADSVFEAYWRRHPYAWLRPLLPQTQLDQIFKTDLKAFQSHFSNAPSEVLTTDALTELDTLPVTFAPFDAPTHDKPSIDNEKSRAYTARTSQLAQENTADAPRRPQLASLYTSRSNAVIHSQNCPSPILPGIMHTQLPWSLIDTPESLSDAVNHIIAMPFIGLDVETTLTDQCLCLIQIGCEDQTYIIDPLAVDIAPLAQVFANPKLIKIIHNATFEKKVLAKYGMQINNITDTLQVSRRRYGTKCPGGHSLKAVCNREFGLDMDKTNQTSIWNKRPLSASQYEYAALDAEILIRLYKHFFKI